MSQQYITGPWLWGELPPAPEIDWDGHSPINGEPVTSQIDFCGHTLVFTKSSAYVAQRRMEPMNIPVTVPQAAPNE
jgi:hypothetical protein